MWSIINDVTINYWDVLYERPLSYIQYIKYGLLVIATGTDRECLKIISWLESTLRIKQKAIFLPFILFFGFFILLFGLLPYFIFIFSGTDRECLKIIWWLESTLRMKQKAIFWPFIPSLTATFIYWPMSTHPPQLRYTNIWKDW